MHSLGPSNRSWKRRVAALASIAALALLLAAPSFAQAGPRDRDRDGLSNGYEVGHSKTSPTRRDTDRDHLGDGFEVRRSHTNPLKRDTDGDSLTDAYEWRHSKTSPLRTDTDRDGTADGVELMLRQDPLANERGKKPLLRDKVSPQTAITAGPSGTVTNRDAGFSFTSSEAGSSFQCKLDAAAWGSCASPRGYSAVADGLHNFSVRATDPAGNVDPTPDTRAWTVAVPPPPAPPVPPVLDTTPPETAITSGPSGTVANGNASFSFSSSEIGSSFQCRLDAAAWSNCSSPQGYSGLAGGTHTFSVRATDLATNTDPSPATASWTVATTAGPTASFSWSPQNPQNPPVQVTFTSTSTCPATPCTYDWRHGPPGNEPIGTGTTASWTFQSTGTKTVVLKVTDSAGRVAEATNNITVGSAPTPKRCANGADDDGDGKVDLADPGCTDAADDDETDVVTPPPPPPPTGGWPNASNTGVPAGTVLTPSGGMTITTAGTVIDSRDISGPVVVNAPNVTIRRSRIRTSAFWIVRNNSTGLLIEDSELDGLNGNGNGVGSSNITLRRVNLHGSENGFDVDGNLTVVDSYIHDLTTTGGAHTDGAQFNQGAADIVFRHNTIDPVAGTSGGTSCIIMWDEGGAQNTRVWIEDNRLLGTGAAWALYSPRQTASQIYINRNRFMSGVYGVTNGVRVGTTVTEFNGNVYDNTGSPVSPND
jgi:hypothetical protein